MDDCWWFRKQNRHDWKSVLLSKLVSAQQSRIIFEKRPIFSVFTIWALCTPRHNPISISPLITKTLDGACKFGYGSPVSRCIMPLPLYNRSLKCHVFYKLYCIMRLWHFIATIIQSQSLHHYMSIWLTKFYHIISFTRKATTFYCKKYQNHLKLIGRK